MTWWTLDEGGWEEDSHPRGEECCKAYCRQIYDTSRYRQIVRSCESKGKFEMTETEKSFARVVITDAIHLLQPAVEHLESAGERVTVLPKDRIIRSPACRLTQML